MVYYYLYGYKTRNGRKIGKPCFLASCTFEDVADATREAESMGYVGIEAFTKMLPDRGVNYVYGGYSVTIGRGI